VLADLACGAGGPGLWVAAESGASVVGIDPSGTGLVEARKRADAVGLGDRARYQHGTFAETGLADAAADAVLSVDAIQYAPDKRAVFQEIRRIMCPGAHLSFTAFEVEPDRVEGLPVLGVDPVPDYGPLLEKSGLAVDWYRSPTAGPSASRRRLLQRSRQCRPSPRRWVRWRRRLSVWRRH
jgi:SAM-dependent methyltransferase